MQWHFHLGRRDILVSPSGACVPAASLVGSVVASVHRSSGRGVGFAVLSNVHAVPAAARDEFQVALVEEIWSQLAAHDPALPDRSALTLNAFHARDGHLPLALTGRPFTVRTLHFDPHSLLFAHRYEGAADQTSTTAVLVDVKRYLEGTSRRLEDVFVASNDDNDRGRLLARAEFRDGMIHECGKRVTFYADGRSHLLIVRNHPFQGVAHEIQVAESQLARAEYRREFFRTSLARPHARFLGAKYDST